MNCQDFIDFLIEYYEGKLPLEQLAKFEEHMARCPPCVNYLETYKQTIILGKAVFQCQDDTIPSNVPDGIVDAILAARKANVGANPTDR